MTKTKILAVDDEPGFTRLLKLALSRYDIETENNPLHAIAVAKRFKPDLILLDIVMPEMDGVELAAKIKSDRTLGRTPIVLVSATISDDPTKKGQKMIGGFPCLAKPVDPERLEKCIESRVRRPRLGSSRAATRRKK